MGLSRNVLLFGVALCVYSADAYTSHKRTDRLEIPTRTLDRMERLLADIMEFKREENEKKVEDSPDINTNLESPKEIVDHQTVESVKEPMAVDDVRHASAEDTASKKEDVDKQKAKDEKETPKNSAESFEVKSEDKTPAKDIKDSETVKASDKTSDNKKTDLATQKDDTDKVTATNIENKDDSSKTDNSKEASKPDESNSKDKNIPVQGDDSRKDKIEDATDESQEVEEVDQDSKDEIALIKLLEDEMKHRLNSKHKKHQAPAKSAEKTDVDSSEDDKDSNSVGDELGEQYDEKDDNEKEAEKMALEQDSELKEFARFRQEVLRKIEKMLVGDVSLALQNGFTVEDIIKDLEKLKQKKEKVKQNQMEEDLTGLEKILAHET